MAHRSPAPQSTPPRATPDPRSAVVQQRRIGRIPAFTPAELRGRRDGWTPERQAAFIGYLAETRCVKAAAARVGMSRESAYRLRRKPEAADFAAAWDHILTGSASAKGAGGGKRKVTLARLSQRVRLGRYRPILHARRYVGIQQIPDNKALLSVLAHLHRVTPRTDCVDVGAAERTKQGRLDYDL